VSFLALVVQARSGISALTARTRNSALLRNSFWVLGGSSARLVLQAWYFLLIARALGAREYGAFVGAVSLVAIFAPFSGWGTSFLLMKEVARDRRTFGRRWGTALGVTPTFGCLLLVPVLSISRVLWGISIPWHVLLLVGISDLIVVRMVDMAVHVFVAVEVLRKSSEVNIVLGATRALAATYLSVAVKHPSASRWSSLYLLSAVVAAAYGVLTVSRSFGIPRLRFWLTRSEFKEGFYFAIGLASQTIYNDIDKTMLVRWGGLAATGVYGAAYRIVDVSFAPVASLVYAAFARFFRHGQGGISGSTMFARKLLPYTASYGVFATVLLIVTSPLVPLFLGSQFSQAAIALRWLSPLVIFKSIHYFLADSMTGAGFQGLRASIQVGIVAINVLLNVWLIPTYSWRGAAWASIASDGLLLVFLWLAIEFINHRSAESLKCAQLT
jgi:O-antigen/teichoic acid export membrane protein